jgi:hypothetical protein
MAEEYSSAQPSQPEQAQPCEGLAGGYWLCARTSPGFASKFEECRAKAFREAADARADSGRAASWPAFERGFGRAFFILASRAHTRPSLADLVRHGRL